MTWVNHVFIYDNTKRGERRTIRATRCSLANQRRTGKNSNQKNTVLSKLSFLTKLEMIQTEGMKEHISPALIPGAQSRHPRRRKQGPLPRRPQSPRLCLARPMSFSSIIIFCQKLMKCCNHFLKNINTTWCLNDYIFTLIQV